MEEESQITTDHKIIKDWAKERGGRPAVVKDEKGDRTELLRIDFGENDPTLAGVSWEDFFEVFDKNNLAFMYRDKTEGGEMSQFFKLVDRVETSGLADREEV